MSLIQRCAFCDGTWVNWNIKLKMIEEPVYAYDCYKWTDPSNRPLDPWWHVLSAVLTST